MSIPNHVTLTISAAGAVGAGKSRAIEVVLAALRHSKIAHLINVEHSESDQVESAVAQVTVKEPWRSAR